MRFERFLLIAAASLLLNGCSDEVVDGDGWRVTEFEEAVPDTPSDTQPDRCRLNDVDCDNLSPDPNVRPDPDPVDPVDPDPTDPPLLTEIRAAFVSGHLGSYMDCPDQGYSEQEAGGAPDPNGEFGACADGDSECGFLNCEGAQLTLQLENTGEIDATNIDITRIELLNTDREWVADLPILGVVDAAGDDAEPIALTVDEVGLFRVDYMGPTSPRQLLETATDDGTSGFLRITIDADDVEEFTLESTELYVLQAIAT